MKRILFEKCLYAMHIQCRLIIEDGCIIASNSCIHSKENGQNQIILGDPTRTIKENINWQQ